MNSHLMDNFPATCSFCKLGSQVLNFYVMTKTCHPNWGMHLASALSSWFHCVFNFHYYCWDIASDT